MNVYEKVLSLKIPGTVDPMFDESSGTLQSTSRFDQWMAHNISQEVFMIELTDQGYVLRLNLGAAFLIPDVTFEYNGPDGLLQWLKVMKRLIND